MSYREDETAAARRAANIAELEQRLETLQRDSAALDKAARAQWMAGLAALKRPLVVFVLMLAFGGGLMIGTEIGRQRRITVDLCAPGTPLPEDFR
jgi:hypothetical protein